MKICIVSDSHDHREHLTAAVTEAKQLGALAVLHCGDLEKMEFEIRPVPLPEASSGNQAVSKRQRARP